MARAEERRVEESLGSSSLTRSANLVSKIGIMGEEMSVFSASSQTLLAPNLSPFSKYASPSLYRRRNLSLGGAIFRFCERYFIASSLFFSFNDITPFARSKIALFIGSVVLNSRLSFSWIFISSSSEAFETGTHFGSYGIPSSAQENRIGNSNSIKKIFLH